MNIKLLRRVKRAILKEPKHFDMCFWACGTTACIGGWGVHLQEKHKVIAATRMHFKQAEHFYGTTPEEVAIGVFQLTKDEARRLFYITFWPYNFQRQSHTAKTNRGRARAAANRIDFFIKTKGTDVEE